MVKNNKKCLVCGAVYSYCGSCAEYRHLPTWMTTFHSDNCRKVFNIVSGYNSGSLSREDALVKLNDCDLTDKSKYTKSIINVVDEINTVRVETIGQVSEEMEEVIETISNPEDAVENVVEQTVVDKDITVTENVTSSYNTYSKKSKKSKYVK